MKTIQLFAYATVCSILLSSCATEETFNPEPVAEDFIKSLSVKRDLSGAYYVDYELENNVTTESTQENGVYNIEAYATDNVSRKSNSEYLDLEKGTAKINLRSENSDENTQITIFDDTKVMAKGTNNNEMLAAYGITKNEDNTYDLNFTVKDGVTVDFVYNETSEEYEIHLEQGNGSETQFNRVLKKETENPLVFAFFNHDNTSARTSTETRKRPVVVVDNGEDS